MIQRCERFRLTLKSRQTLGIVSKVLRKDLDRDLALQPRIAGAIDLAHAACTDGGDDLVRAEAHAVIEGHAGLSEDGRHYREFQELQRVASRAIEAIAYPCAEKPRMSRSSRQACRLHCPVGRRDATIERQAESGACGQDRGCRKRCRWSDGVQS